MWRSIVFGMIALACVITSLFITPLRNGVETRMTGIANYSSYINSEVQGIISTLHLNPHPEGGYYRETFRSGVNVTPQGVNFLRTAMTGMYFLLNHSDFSTWHKLNYEEMWLYHKGNCLIAHLIDMRGNYSYIILGDSLKNKDAVFEFTVPPQTWFAVELLDKSGYSLVSNVVAPGFEWDDFEMPPAEKLVRLFPQHEELIYRLSRKHSNIEENRTKPLS